VNIKSVPYVYMPDYRDLMFDHFDYASINEFVFIADDKYAGKKLVNVCGIDGKYLGMVHADNLHEII
jgi:hypothetical protein